MKTKFIYAAIVAGSLYFGFVLNSQNVSAAATPDPDPGGPPIGKQVEITVISWPLRQTPLKINGSLVAMQPDWVVVNEGNYDQWIPASKVMIIRASK
jgi:hypothetical protein